MKQTTLIIIFLATASFSFSQMQNLTVTKKDGTVLNVKRYSGKAKYLKLIFDNGTSKELPYNQLGKIEYEYKYKRDTKKVTKQFVRMSKRNGSLMELVVEGKCNVYKNLAASGAGAPVTIYYAKKNDEPIATKLGSNGFIDLANYKKSALKYFNDCPVIIKKIKKKYKRKKIMELVEFYNNNCF